MDYLIQMEDGSSAYLSHHGVKGMKWGNWNAETAARYAAQGKAGGSGGGGIMLDDEYESEKEYNSKRNEYETAGTDDASNKKRVQLNTKYAETRSGETLSQDISRRVALAKTERMTFAVKSAASKLGKKSVNRALGKSYSGGTFSSAKKVSKEYEEELEYNSKKNRYN